jgi:hypothetical protein
MLAARHFVGSVILNRPLPAVSRRLFVKSAIAFGSFAAVGLPAAAQRPSPARAASADGLPPALMARALAALDQHGARIARRDRMAIADFSAKSSQGRFHIVDLASGAATTLLVAHGRGSDPAHTGWLRQFSNLPGSNASSRGAYLTDDYYVGQHGDSQRLIGLDPTNDNALARAIVIHSAWYAEPAMIRAHGLLGRSEGCFAVGKAELGQLFERLGKGRMIYADKV